MDDLTRSAGDATRPSGSAPGSTLTSSSGTGWGRFAPGTVLAGRFRIVAPLGRSGMGEVYRADDLKLGQTVALKLLPDELLHDAARLAQFHNEVRVALVGRDVLIGVAAGTIGALLIASRTLIPHAFNLPRATPELPTSLILFGTRFALSTAIQIVRRAMVLSMQVVGIVVFLKIVLRRNRLVMTAAPLAVLPMAMRGTFAGEQLALELAISLLGIALIFTVLLRWGLLALIITFYTFLAIEAFPLTTDLGRPYAGASFVVVATIAALSIFGFYASRGDEPIFGRPLLD